MEARADKERAPWRRTIPGEETDTMRIEKTGSRRRTYVVTVKGGHILPDKWPLHAAGELISPCFGQEG